MFHLSQLFSMVDVIEAHSERLAEVKAAASLHTFEIGRAAADWLVGLNGLPAKRLIGNKEVWRKICAIISGRRDLPDGVEIGDYDIVVATNSFAKLEVDSVVGQPEWTEPVVWSKLGEDGFAIFEIATLDPMMGNDHFIFYKSVGHTTIFCRWSYQSQQATLYGEPSERFLAAVNE